MQISNILQGKKKLEARIDLTSITSSVSDATVLCLMPKKIHLKIRWRNGAW